MFCLLTDRAARREQAAKWGAPGHQKPAEESPEARVAGKAGQVLREEVSPQVPTPQLFPILGSLLTTSQGTSYSLSISVTSSWVATPIQMFGKAVAL